MAAARSLLPSVKQFSLVRPAFSKGAVLPLHHGVRDSQFRFANFPSGEIPKVYSHSAEAVGDPEIMMFRMQTPRN